MGVLRTMNKKAQAKKYILYARKSTESDDKQAASIDSQLNEMNPIAKKRGINIVETITESCSGYKEGRGGFNKLKDMIENGKVDGIICWSLSRLARNPLDAGYIMHTLQLSKIKNIITHKKDYYPTDSTMLLYVEFGINNQYSQDLSVDTLRGLRQKAARGWNPRSTLPLGYIHNPNEKLRKFSDEEIIKDPERFELVKTMFRDILDNGFIPAQAINKVRKLGLTTKYGNSPSDSVMYRILKNPFYHGEFEYPKKGKTYEGKHPKIISKKEYKRLQEILHRKNPPSVIRHKHKYTGLFICSKCGYAVTGEPVKTKILKNGKTGRYKYYRCSHKKENCGGRYIREKELESEIITDLKRLFIPTEILEIIKESVNEEISQRTEESEKDRFLTQQKIDELEQKKERLLDLYIDQRVSGEVYERKKNLIEKDIEGLLDLQIEVDEIQDKDLPPSINIKNFKKLDIEVRKKLLRDVYNKMSYYDGKIELEHHDLLDVFYNVPSKITKEYYEVRTDESVDMKEFIKVRVQENSTWGG